MKEVKREERRVKEGKEGRGKEGRVGGVLGPKSWVLGPFAARGDARPPAGTAARGDARPPGAIFFAAGRFRGCIPRHTRLNYMRYMAIGL